MGGVPVSVEHMAVVLHHSRAAGTDKVIMLGIANHAGDGGAWPAVSTLATYGNIEPRAVQRSLVRLVEMGELTIEPRAGRSNLYHVRVECPDTCAGGPNHRPRKTATSPDMGMASTTGVAQTTGVSSTTGGGVVHDGGGVSSTTPEPSMNPKEPPSLAAGAAREPKPSTPTTDHADTGLATALATACGINHTEITPRGQTQLAAALRDLDKVGATPQTVHDRAHAYRQLWPNATLTPLALAKHWPILGTLPTSQPTRPEHRAVRDVFADLEARIAADTAKGL